MHLQVVFNYIKNVLTLFFSSAGDTIKLEFNVGTGNHSLESASTYVLNNDLWHTAFVEGNLKQVTLKIDQNERVVYEGPFEQDFFRPTFTSPLILG